MNLGILIKGMPSHQLCDPVSCPVHPAEANGTHLFVSNAFMLGNTHRIKPSHSPLEQIPSSKEDERISRGGN